MSADIKDEQFIWDTWYVYVKVVQALLFRFEMKNITKKEIVQINNNEKNIYDILTIGGVREFPWEWENSAICAMLDDNFAL